MTARIELRESNADQAVSLGKRKLKRYPFSLDCIENKKQTVSVNSRQRTVRG